MNPDELEALELYRQQIQQHYTPRHPHLYTLKKEMLASSLVAALEDGSEEALRGVLHEESPQIYSFDMLRREFCEQFLEEVASFEQWCDGNNLPRNVPNSMNNYGVVLDDFGFWPFLQKLMQKSVQPFARMLYPEVGGDSLDAHHGFVVEYALKKDTDLAFHVDASDVTLNICLGREFTGGELYFGGIRCSQCQEMTPPLPEEEFFIQHLPGRALLHRGKHRHSATAIKSGERLNLILWCVSSQYQRSTDLSQCPSWCGWHGRNR